MVEIGTRREAWRVGGGIDAPRRLDIPRVWLELRIETSVSDGDAAQRGLSLYYLLEGGVRRSAMRAKSLSPNPAALSSRCLFMHPQLGLGQAKRGIANAAIG